MIRRPDYSQIDKSKNIYFLASGGRDSSAMILEAFRLGIKGTMTFNHTYYDGSAIPILKKLEHITSYPLKIIRYEGEEKPRDILREAFRALPDAIADMKDKGRFNKRFFKCCIKRTIFFNQFICKFFVALFNCFSYLFCNHLKKFS